MSDAPGRGLLISIAAAVCLATAAKAYTWTLSHNEPDEVIYWTLAHSLARRGTYTLQGTQLLQELPAGMYDRPLFHHPPLYPLLLAPFAAAGAWQAAILVSWLGHALCVVAVGLFAGRVARQAGCEPFSPAVWVPLFAVALDPLLLFVSRKLWIDSLLAGLVALGLVLTFLAHGARRERALLWAGGLLLGLAALAKLVALLALPVAAWLAARGRPGPPRLRRLARVLLPPLVLVLPWLVWFRLECGAFLPWWSRPSAEMLARDPFIRSAAERGPAYYALKTALVQPVFVLGLALAARARARPAALGFPLLWLAVFLVALTAISQAGGSPHFLRYLAPAFPAAACLLAAPLARDGAPSWLAPLAVALAALAALGSAQYLFTSNGNEIRSVLEILLRVDPVS